MSQYCSSAAHARVRAAGFRIAIINLLVSSALAFGAGVCVRAQDSGFERELDAPGGQARLFVKNRLGRVTVVAAPPEEELRKITVRARSPQGVAVSEKDVKVGAEEGRLSVVVERESAAGARPSGALDRNRIDVEVRVPARAKVEVETEVGAVDVVGPLASAEVRTDTGTIRADVPTDALKYNFRWTLARPRFYSEVELGKIKQKRGGDSEISGRLGDKE